jgi:hypothetical protein
VPTLKKGGENHRFWRHGLSQRVERKDQKQSKITLKTKKWSGFSVMGLIKLHMEPILNTVKDKCSKIKKSFQNIMTLVTLVCNSATSKYEGESRPRVRVTQNDIAQSFLYDTGAQRS